MIANNHIKNIKIAAIFFIITNTNISYANEYNLSEALKKHDELSIKQPKAQDDGRVQTLNKKGAMSPVFDEATKEFIKFSEGKKVLEIGGAYGKAMLETLKINNKTTYHINDLDERHLLIAAHNLQMANINKKSMSDTRFVTGDITKEDFSIGEKYDAILTARVMHFFTPRQFDIALSNIYKLLKEKGRIYAVAITPYIKRYEKFIPEYEKRLKNNEKYPGYVNSIIEWVNTEVTNKEQLAQISDEPFMFLDDKTLIKLFEKHNFRIIKCKMMPLEYQSNSWSLDGRENVILIAEKII